MLGDPSNDGQKTARLLAAFGWQVYKRVVARPIILRLDNGMLYWADARSSNASSAVYNPTLAGRCKQGTFATRLEAYRRLRGAGAHDGRNRLGACGARARAGPQEVASVNRPGKALQAAVGHLADLYGPASFDVPLGFRQPLDQLALERFNACHSATTESNRDGQSTIVLEPGRAMVLDTGPDGSGYEPNPLFIEAVRSG